MILNLSRLNKFIDTPRFKLVTTATLRNLIPEGAWMGKLDLQDAYLHVPVHPRFRKFLAFSFKGELYYFNALPFGFSPAPYISPG